MTKAEISKQVGASAQLRTAPVDVARVHAKKAVKDAVKVVEKKAASSKAKGSSSQKPSTAAKKAAKRPKKRLSRAEAEAKAKMSYDRLVKLRADRLDLGLKRHDVYVHDDDWKEVKDLVAEKHRVRQALAEKKSKRAAAAAIG